ncbi:MAG TPA: L,D-transpeptidase family protein [Parafilimonas sp.]|nr:L,D-transpeptidase family protein [Parafilimonas sp.]
MKVRKVYLVYIVLSVFFFFSCNSFKSKSQDSDTTIHKKAEEAITPGNFNDNSGIKFDSAAIQKFLSEKPLFREFSKEFDTFYRANNFSYVWYDNNGLIETSGTLISAIENIEGEGVTANVPYKDSLDQLLNNIKNVANNNKPDINAELMLTGEYFFYAKKIWAGSLSSKTTSMNWYLPRKKFSYSALLEDNLSKGTLAGVEGPVIAMQHAGLKKALTHYRDIEKQGGEVTVPGISKTIKPNQASTVIPFIRKRLFQLGDVHENDTSDVYDVKLAEAVNYAKLRYGLKPDSLITNSLINEINIPAKKRVEQIMVNMERMRWVTGDTSSNELILVNIPEYTLRYFEDNKEVWNCNVVVGKPMTKTVIFSGKMQYVVFSPYWNVPPSIINGEVLPGMRRNKNYLARHNMEWNGGRVRQKPGPSNSLGLVKFLFPNSNNIYLHDTPSKSLFSEDSRAFSHGCIRVAKPRDLAIRVLQQMPEWTPQKIDAAMHAGKEQYVTLKKTIPVYIGYFTAFMSSDGQLNFRTDVYKRDASLLEMLMQN